MLRKILAVIGGALVWTVLWLMLNAGLTSAFPTHIVPGQPLVHTGILLTLTGSSVVLSVLAGFVTGSIAAARPVAHATALAVLQLALGLYFETVNWDVLPVWYHLIFLVLLVPTTVAGGVIVERRRATQRS